ncbi:UDP-glucose 4-epimerase GalE [Desulfoluna spongiiphila]|uniref:UDP-glucose 4-epimerase GalE n=1 Tax=Desulfoluna spongiiphila TaxID=419481 RepID=UPI0012582B45|nr:UDP-glucose 4-epimerase GalE [Desulfoluna spongiiphila]VVS91872.1 udp-glucose 4-epimerase [Desulfoluna spongiiphila]
MHVLITGGAGYIGSHTCLELLESGHQVTVVDNLSNSSEESLRRVEALTGKSLAFVKGDLLDEAVLDSLFASHRFDAVIHFAGLKAVGESVEMPLAYYQNNLTGTLNLLHAMDRAGVKNIIFSSSATVYGEPETVPMDESFPRSATNPYGRSKLIVEEMLEDLLVADSSWRVVLLRYFNPVGAHESGRIGEDPNGIPNNLMPYIAQVAVGKLERLSVFGSDYPTHDGTGVRDFIHVVDLAKGHLCALKHTDEAPGLHVYNLGTGQGYSVLDMVGAFEEASGRPVPYVVAPRRPGDIAVCYASPDKAWNEIGWRAEKGVEAMCRDAWKWQSENPDGYPA